MKTADYVSTGERRVTGITASGLPVIVVPKLEYTKSFAFLATDYGGADRRFRIGRKWCDTPAGVAHFLEHKMFDQPDGTNALPVLSSMGASPNAFTSTDITAYHFECADNFDEDLKLLIDFVFTPYYTEESVAKEQGIIGQEIRMTEDNPWFALYYDFLKALYRAHPLRDSVAGTVESISHITAQTLYDCHAAFYVPRNMVLCVAGDQDPEHVFDLAQRELQHDSGEKPERDYGPDEAGMPVRMRTERTMEVGLPLFMTGCKSAAPACGDGYLRRLLTSEIALEILCGKSSPLYLELYAKGLINQSFSAEYEISAGTAHSAVSGESRDPEAVAGRLREETARFIADGPAEGDFARVRKALTGAKLRELDSLETICYSTAKGYFKGYDYLTSSEVLRQITPEETVEFVRTALDPDQFALSVVSPAGQERHE